MTAQGKDGAAYLDSMRNETVWLGKTLKDCEALQIGLGLDLKGGMNVVLEVSVPDVVKNLAGESANDPKFKEAYSKAVAQAKKGDIDFVDAFVSAYQQLNGTNKLGGIFASKLGEKNISYNSSDADVKKVLNEEVNAAVENSNKVVRSRIDRFGVAQPNIQILRGKGQIGQIMVEMPGIKEPERVRKLLQGSANLEFWETYTLGETMSSLTALDKRLAGADAKDSAAADSTKAKAAKAKSAAEQHPLFSKLIMMQGMQPTKLRGRLCHCQGYSRHQRHGQQRGRQEHSARRPQAGLGREERQRHEGQCVRALCAACQQRPTLNAGRRDSRRQGRV